MTTKRVVLLLGAALLGAIVGDRCGGCGPPDRTGGTPPVQ